MGGGGQGSPPDIRDALNLSRQSWNQQFQAKAHSLPARVVKRWWNNELNREKYVEVC
jgi:hypothetical protein